MQSVFRHMCFKRHPVTFIVCLHAILLLVVFNREIQAAEIDLSTMEASTLGYNIQYVQETGDTLTLDQARQLFTDDNKQKGLIKQGQSASISLGIGVAPAWLKFTVNNQASDDALYRLAIETPWLDYIDTWLVQQGHVVRHIKGGDALPFEQRPMPYKYYAFEHQFAAGVTEVYIRVETLGPMAIPVHLSRQADAVSRDISQSYQYGFLYGIMSALALYNIVLFLFIRQREYGLYGLYLIGFVLNSLSYTGQLHTVITPDLGPYFQDWTDIFLMITYSVAGLHFARILLKTEDYAPKLDQFTKRVTWVIPVGMVFGFIMDKLVFSMALAFILNCSFVVLFVAMGISALKAKKPFAVIFLFSSVTAAICITISTLAVAGILVPYNDLTFKAIEVGMALEAILLAVILARQFRMAKLDKVIAENYAMTDFLTQLRNRRGFQEVTHAIWQNLKRTDRNAAIVLLDIDEFKQINDRYGHHSGDLTLEAVAKCLNQTIRTGDIAARWGGEEFVVFLPETEQAQAIMQAERIRKAIADLTIEMEGHLIQVTASIGVAGNAKQDIPKVALADLSVEQLINQADSALYSAKHGGKNQVYCA